MRLVEIVDPVRKIILRWPVGARQEFGAILLRLQNSEFVGMPDVRAMPTVRKGVYEIRLKTREGAYRAFYISSDQTKILVFHAFEKKRQQTPRNEIETARLRLDLYFRNRP